MKKSFLLTILLFIIGFCVNDGLKAQCPVIPNKLATATYDVRVGGDFVFDQILQTGSEVIGFTHVSPIVSGFNYQKISTNRGRLKFTISWEFMEDMGRYSNCFDIEIMYRGGGVSVIRIEFIK